MTIGQHVGPFLIGPHKRSGVLTGKWLVNIPKSIGGERIRKFFENRKQAIQFAKRLEQKYRRGELSQRESIPKARMTFRQAVKEWTELQKLRVSTNKKRAISLKTDEFRLKEAMSFFGDDLLSAISESRLAQYQDRRLKSGRSPATINSDMKTIVQILRWAQRTGHLNAVPFVERVPEEPVAAIIPTQKEVVRIIECLPSRLRPVVRFMAETGCRSGEAFNLTWDCVSVSKGYAEIKPKDGWTPKTRASIRRVPLSRKLIRMLRQLPKVGDYVFRGRVSGKPINNVRKAFATAVRKAGVARKGKPCRVTPHTLRKAYATWQAIENGVPQRVLKSLLGHSAASQVTDRHYVIPQDESIRKAVLELPMGVTREKSKKPRNGNSVATR